MRALAIPGIPLVLLAHLFASVAVWEANRNPESAEGPVRPHSETLTTQAEIEVQAGLAALSDRSRTPAERLSNYRDRLSAGRVLLVRSLSVNPAQPAVLATLATIDHELSPTDPATRDRVLTRIGIAASLAPRVPRVQAQLGDLLLRMGLPDEALGYLGRAADLDDAFADRAVRLAATYGLAADDIRRVMPRRAASLAALRGAYRPEEIDRYLELVETAIDDGSVEPTRELLLAYADAALSSDRAAQLAGHAAEWGPYTDPDLESFRLMICGRAALAQGDAPTALEFARAGQALDPESHRLANFLGDTARAAKQPEAAIEAYRHGLGLLARRNAVPQARAYIYRRIGEAQEDLHRPDLAYDSYARALELDPDEPHARKRTHELAVRDGS